MDVNVVFLRDGHPLSAANRDTDEPSPLAVPPQADTARIVSPGALRMWITQYSTLHTENVPHIVIPPATIDHWPVDHGQYLHFGDDPWIFEVDPLGALKHG